jgi:hypothetical protein
LSGWCITSPGRGCYYAVLAGLTAISSLIYAQTELPLVDFQPTRGFYSSAFELTLAVKQSGAQIGYTLDGSDPSNSTFTRFLASPATIRIDPLDMNGRPAAPAVVVRACGLVGQEWATRVTTHTFLFVNYCTYLSPHGSIPGQGWPKTNTTLSVGQFIDYGMDPRIYENPRYANRIIDALLAVPSFSLTTDIKNLFDRSTGIYMNALKHGPEWERPVSVELLRPDGRPGFQIDAGLRIRGGYSRHDDNPKHAWRLFFNKEYGPGELEYPLFEDEGVREFDHIDLRTSQNYSWAYQGDARHTFLRDIFSRDTQRDMNQPYTRSRYVHLYLNGVYWGLYQTQERSEASFAASYFGGEQEDYDVIKVDSGEQFNLYEIEATDGLLDDYRTLWQLVANGVKTDELYYKLQGRNADGSVDPKGKIYVDVDNLIDYMLCTFYTGDFDGPLSGFRNNTCPNNYYTIFNRVSAKGFLFFRHDAEHSLFANHLWGTDRTGPFPAGSEFRHFNPQWLHQQLVSHPRYLARFSDRTFRHLFHNGALTPTLARQRLLQRKQELQTAIFAESARWGDAKTKTPLTPDDWETAVNSILNEFIPNRTNALLSQLVKKGWYSTANPPEILPEKEILASGRPIVMNAASGTIYYTLDGHDPYLLDSAQLPYTFARWHPPAGVFIYSAPLAPQHNLLIKARVFDGRQWSPVQEKAYYFSDDRPALRITEIHYNPGGDNGSEYEFLELRNISTVPVDLSNARFTSGVSYTFPIHTALLANGYYVLASNRVAFHERYGFYPSAEYDGQLDNKGEMLCLLSQAGDTLIACRYDNKFPWPNLADGWGRSLVSRDEDATQPESSPAYWRSSSQDQGSPGGADVTTGISTQAFKPEAVTLYQNYPNPFNESTKLSFELSRCTKVSLTVYNALGQISHVLFAGSLSAGLHAFTWNSIGCSSGLYFCVLEADEARFCRKLLLIH